MTDNVDLISNSVMPSYARPSNICDDFHIRLFAVSYVRLERGLWNAQNVRDSFWRFYVNDRDGAALETPGGNFPLRANRLYLIAEDVLFSCANTADVGHFFAHFDVLGLPRPVLRRFFSTPVEVAEAPGLSATARVLARRIKGGQGSAPELHCQVKSLLFGALGCAFARQSADDADDYWRLTEAQSAVAPALEYIENHLSAPLGNAVLARACHWSADHFARVFRQRIGQTPAQYVQARRIAVASQQLLFTENSIEQIARETGFSDRFHFSRVFAQIKGCPPAAYRKIKRV